MRTLLVVMTAAAVVMAFMRYVGVPVALTLIAIPAIIGIPVCLGTLALYCRGHRQTYFLGAFAGALATYLTAGGGFMADPDMLVFVLMPLHELASAFICGLAALFTRRFLERRGWHLPGERRD